MALKPTVERLRQHESKVIAIVVLRHLGGVIRVRVLTGKHVAYQHIKSNGSMCTVAKVAFGDWVPVTFDRDVMSLTSNSYLDLRTLKVVEGKMGELVPYNFHWKRSVYKAILQKVPEMHGIEYLKKHHHSDCDADGVFYTYQKAKYDGRFLNISRIMVIYPNITDAVTASEVLLMQQIPTTVSALICGLMNSSYQPDPSGAAVGKISFVNKRKRDAEVRELRSKLLVMSDEYCSEKAKRTGRVHDAEVREDQASCTLANAEAAFKAAKRSLAYAREALKRARETEEEDLAEQEVATKRYKAARKKINARIKQLS